MPADKCQLTELTYDELLDIEQTAPRVVRLTKATKDVGIGLEGCRTAKDVYDKAEEYLEDGKDYGIELRVIANGMVLVEVERMARLLMEKILSLHGEDERKARKVMIAVLDYQTKLKRQIEVDTEKVNEKSRKGNGYLLFKNLTDEEIEYFWNG